MNVKEKALAFQHRPPRKQKMTKKEMDVFELWKEGRIEISAVKHALGLQHNSQAYIKMALAARK